MSDPWNEPLPLMDDVMISRIISTTDQYLASIQWKNNADPKSLYEAVQMAKQGKDAGEAKTLALRPTSNDFREWMLWNDIVTFLYNRDTHMRTLLSALRKN